MVPARPLLALLGALTSLQAGGCQGVGAVGDPQGASQQSQTGVELYQIGDRWDRQLAHLSVELAADADSVQRRVLAATAQYSGPRIGTAIYLGELAGHHVMATNAHVWKSGRCDWVSFPQAGSKGCKDRPIGVWEDVDLALFELYVPAEEQAAMPKPIVLASAAPRRGQPLITAGFGGALNEDEYMTFERGSDCRVLSGDGDLRPTADPDQYNPGAFRVWSFVTGCDLSHGDSGSGVFDRDLGELVGINWTTATPKPLEVTSSDHVRQMSDQGAPELWTQLALAVPATRITLRLRDALSGELDDDARAVLSALVGAP